MAEWVLFKGDCVWLGLRKYWWIVRLVYSLVAWWILVRDPIWVRMGKVALGQESFSKLTLLNKGPSCDRGLTCLRLASPIYIEKTHHLAEMPLWKSCLWPQIIVFIYFGGWYSASYHSLHLLDQFL